MKVVSTRASLTEKSESLLLDLEEHPAFDKPEEYPVDEINSYIPAGVSLPRFSMLFLMEGNNLM